MKLEYLKRVLLCIFVLCYAVVSVGATKFSKVYDNATQLMVDGDYAGAAELYDSIASYEDASSLSMYCKANLLAEQGNYDEAIAAFEFFGDYKDCKYLVVYYSACKLEAETDAENLEQYLEAAEKFKTISLFRDSSARAEECKQKLYDAADLLLSQKNYEGAYSYFESLGDFSDSPKRMQECLYRLGLELVDEKLFGLAADMFELARDYEDAGDRMLEAQKLSNLIVTHNFLLLNEDFDQIHRYSEAAFYLGDITDNQFNYYVIDIENQGLETQRYKVVCVLDGETFAWEETVIDAGKSRGYAVAGIVSPEHFTEGEHTCVWYVDEIEFFNDTYTVYPGESEERAEELKIAKNLTGSADEAPLTTSVPGVHVHSFVKGVCSECGAKPAFLTDWLPDEFYQEAEHAGTVTAVEYDTEAVAAYDELTYHKRMNVYLPYGYDGSRPYNVLVLIHGHGENEDDWLVETHESGGRSMCGRVILDNIFEQGLAEPCIVVTPVTETKFVQGLTAGIVQMQDELRKTILPYIVEHYSTYAKDGSIESLRAARSHFGLGGLSNGALFTYEGGMQYNFDLFGSYFAFSGNSEPWKTIAAIQEDEFAKLPVDCLFTGSGSLNDWQQNYTKIGFEYFVEKDDRFVEGENAWRVDVEGGHEWKVWYTCLYNAMQVMFQEV